MDKILIPKIEAPKLSPLDFDISLNSPLNSPEFSPIPTEKKEEDIIKKIQRDILNSPKVDLDKIDEQYQDKYVKVTPDELKKINKGDEISERIKFDDNYEALMRSTQTNTERYLNTAKNFGVAASSSFIGGLAAIPNIIGSTINVAGYLSGRDKPISEFFNVGWDSGLNKTLFEFSNEVAENNRNYKSNWSKENWIQDMIPIFGDGGFQDIVASSGYTVGAMAEAFLTGGIGSVISKGTRIAGMGGRISKYLNNPAKLDKMFSLFKAINKEDNVRKVIGEVGYLIGKGIEEAPQLYRMYAGSHFESAFEGLEGAKRFEEEAIQKYKENNFGMLPDQKTLENIKSTAQEIGDMRYGLNLAVLMIPNYLQMGALLKTFPGAEKFSKKVFGENTLGEIVSDSGKFSVKKTKDIKLNWTPEGKVGKFLKNAAEKTIKYGQEYSKIPLSFSEGMEEYMQYIIDEYSNSLYKGVYMHPETSIKTGEYISEMFKTIADKGLNKEAIQSFLMGSIGGGIQQTFNTGYEIATGSNRLKNKIAQNEIIASKLEELSKSIFSKDSMKESVTEEDKKMLIDILSNSLNQNSLGGTLEEKYNQALSSLNSLSVLENILKSESVHAQRWYYNIKDRHISQILHDVVETGKQDVFKDHLSQIASSPVEVINQLYNIDINEQTRDHTLFVNDVLDKLNKIENISKTIKFSFNDDFKDPLTQIKYSQYKRELSHMKFMIDRQKERRNGLMSPKINSLSKFLTSDYSELENRINTLKLVQPDTQDYTNVQEELKRLENALDLIKKSTTYEVIENEDGEEIEVLDNVNLQNIADAYNLIENNNENTTKTAYEDLVKANDIKIIDESLSNNSNTIKRYKKLYNDFNFYLEENKDYFKVLDEIFAKEERLKNIKKEVDKEFDKESDKTKLDIISEIIQIEENDKLSEEEKKTQKKSVIQKFKDKLKPVEKVKDNVVNKSQETPDLSKDAEKEKEKDATSVVDKEKLDDVSKIINNEPNVLPSSDSSSTSQLPFTLKSLNDLGDKFEIEVYNYSDKIVAVYSYVLDKTINKYYTVDPNYPSIKMYLNEEVLLGMLNTYENDMSKWRIVGKPDLTIEITKEIYKKQLNGEKLTLIEEQIIEKQITDRDLQSYFRKLINNETGNNNENISSSQKTTLDKINSLIEDGKKAKLIKETKDKESHYSFLGKLYKRVTTYVGELIEFTDKKTVTNLKNSVIVGNYFDTFARMYFKNNNLTIGEFKKGLEEKENKDGVIQFKNIDVKKIFDESLKRFGKIKDDIKKQLNDDNLIFVTDEIFVHNDLKIKEDNNEWDGVAGTLDMVVIDSQGKVHIYDFKMKTENDSRYPITTDKLETPFKKGQKSDKQKWTAQQTAYSTILEKTFGYYPNINIVVIPASYKKQDFEGSVSNNDEVNNFNPLPTNLKFATTQPFIYKLEFDKNNKLYKIINEEINNNQSNVNLTINNTNIEPLFLDKDTIKKQLENLSYSEKINKLIELGILTSLNVDGKLSNDINDVHLGWTVDRPIVFMKLGNDIVPFYRSSKGTGGKEKNRWYPFFGFGTDGWVIKGTVPEMERYYDNPLFKLVGDILTEEINYEGGLDLQKGNLKDFHPLFSKGEKSLNSKQINLLLYQKETIDINNLNQGFDKNIQYNKIKTLLDNWNTYLSNIKNKNQSNTQDILDDKVLESVAEIVNDAQTSDKSENYNQVGNSNYYEKDGLVFYQNEDGTLKPIPNPDKKDVLEVVKDDIEERRRFETVYVEDRLKKEADLAKTLDFTNHRDERLWELLGMFFQAITEFTSKGKNYTIVKGFSKYYKNVLDEEGNVVIVISRSGLEYDIHNTSREDAKEILSHAQKKGYDENKEKQINDKYDKELESLNQQNTQKQPTTDIEAKKADIEKRRQEKLIFTFGKNIDVISSGRLAVIERNVYFTPKYPKGANRLANREDAEKLVNEYIEINAEYDKELAKELYKEMESGKMITEFTPDEQKILNKYNTPELRKSVEEELEKLEENFNTKDLEGQEFTILYFGGNNENGEFDDNYIKKSTDEFYFQIIPDENGKTGRLIPNTSLSTVNTIIQNSNVFQNSLEFNRLSFTPTKMDILEEGVVAKTNTGWKVTKKAVVNIIDERETEQSLNDKKSETLESNIKNQQLESLNQQNTQKQQEAELEAKKADIERRKQEALKRPYNLKNKELSDANEIASYGENYSDALDNLIKKQQELNDILNKRQKEETKDRNVHQYTKEELEAQPEYEEIKRLGGLINQINEIYGEAYGFDAKTSKGIKEIEQEIVDLPQKRKTADSKIIAKYNAELTALEGTKDILGETFESNIENQQLESTQEIDQNEDELLLNKENENTGTPIPPISKPVSSVPNSKDNIIFMQNDFYLNDTGLGVLNKKKGNEMLLKRRKFLNSINNVSDIDFKVDKTIITLDEIEKQEIAGGKLLKINNAPIFVISTKQDDEEIILQEYRDLRNGWGISKQYLQSLEIELKDNFDFNSENIVNAKNFESISRYVSLFNVIEYLEENNTNKLEELLDNLGIERSYLDLSIERQKTLEKSLKGKNVKLKRLLTNYISSKRLQGSTLNSNYTELVPVDELPNNKVIDENGNQYTAVLYLKIPYVQINEQETAFSNNADFRNIIKEAIQEGTFYGSIPESLQEEIKIKLIAQLNETIVNEKGEVVLSNSPATFLSNGFNLIFTDTETNKPYVKNLVSKDISLPDTTDLVSLIKTNEKKGDVRDDGWFINVSGVQEQLNTKFEIYKVEYNNFENEKEKILGISILYAYKDNNGKTIFWRTNYNLDEVKKQNTIDFLKRKIKEDINKKLNPVTDKKDVNFDNFLKNISINFVSSTSEKFKTYEDVVAQNSHVVKGIEFKSGSDDMRNDTTYSFFHDRVEVVEDSPKLFKEDKSSFLEITTPTVIKEEKVEQEVEIREQISPELNVENESELIKFFSTFGTIELLHNNVRGKEILVFNKSSFYVLEEVINNDKNMEKVFKLLIKNKAPLNNLKAVLNSKMDEIYKLYLEKVKPCN